MFLAYKLTSFDYEGYSEPEFIGLFKNREDANRAELFDKAKDPQINRLKNFETRSLFQFTGFDIEYFIKEMEIK